MTHNHTALGKALLLLLALSTPFLLYQGYSNQKELLRYREEIFSSHTQERNRMIGDLALKFFGEGSFEKDVVLRRSLPDGALQGLPECPPPEQVAVWGNVQEAGQTSAAPELLGLLHSDLAFPSGMPQRYAGLVELFLQQEVGLNPVDFQRFYQVVSEFWMAKDLDNGTFRFLLNKMPLDVRCHFPEQMRFLGLDLPDSPNRFLVYISHDGGGYLLAPSIERLAELNRRLEAFLPGLTLAQDNTWRDWNGTRLTLRTEQESINYPLHQMGMVYLGTGLGVELVLVLLYLVLFRFEQVNRTQKRLLATTSHELRTPLAVIRQFAEMLLDRSGQVPPRLATYHQHIHRESLKMQFLVENLLSAARFEHLVLEPNPSEIELGSWLRQLTEVVASLSSHQIRLECPALEVFWDKDLMGQVLTNLCENARIHAETDVDLLVEEVGDRVRIRCRDFGQAPNLKQLSKSEPFKSTGKRGLGLGLFLSTRIVHAHSGTIEFEDAGPGLLVILSLPKDCRLSERKGKRAHTVT